MDRNECRFTVLFQPPFWVGIGERWTQEGYQAARVVFGAEPSDAQVYQWVLTSWHSLPFTAAEAGERPRAVPASRWSLHQGPGGSRPTAGGGRSGAPCPALRPETGGTGGTIPAPAAEKARKTARSLGPRRFDRLRLNDSGQHQGKHHEGGQQGQSEQSEAGTELLSLAALRGGHHAGAAQSAHHRGIE